MQWVRSNQQQVIAIVALLAVFICLSFLSPYFFSSANIFNIGKQASINLILALGMTVVILAGGIDLSVGSLLAVTVVIAGVLNNVYGVPIWPAVAISSGLTIVGGLINGLIIQYARVPSFITTLGMMGILRGLVQVSAKGNPALTFPPEFLWIADGHLLGIPLPIVFAAVLAIAFSILLNMTALGRSFYAIGGNEEAARLSGVNIAFVRIASYTIAGLCCAIAGLIFSARVGAAPPSAGVGYELAAIAAVIIGGTSLEGGRGTIVGTVIGALLMAVIQNGLGILDVDPYWQSVVIGSIIIIAVMFSQWRLPSR